MAASKVVAKKLETTMSYKGSISTEGVTYSFERDKPFAVQSQKHLDVIEAERERRLVLAKG